MRSIKKKIFENFIDANPKLLLKKKNVIDEFEKTHLENKIDIKGDYSLILNLGKLNKDKIFYIIRRTPGAGMFSNVLFVLNHIKIAKKYNFIPVVDMKNFVSIYNDDSISLKESNSWKYYFEQISKYDLEEVYKSHKVIVTSNNFYNFFNYHLEDKSLKKLFDENVLFKKYLKRYIVSFENKFFKNDRVLGVHFRGTSYKTSAGHPLVATKNQMFRLTNKILKNENLDKIFLVTEEKSHLEFFLKKFGKKIVYLKSSFRSNKNNAFTTYPRNKHRYKMGSEIITETVLLSKCDSFLFVDTNVSSAVIALDQNKNQKRFKIDNGFNSKNIFYALIKWYLKKYLPYFLGGFKKEPKLIFLKN